MLQGGRPKGRVQEHALAGRNNERRIGRRKTVTQWYVTHAVVLFEKLSGKPLYPNDLHQVAVAAEGGDGGGGGAGLGGMSL